MIIGNPIMAGASGPSASIFVTGLSETDTVTAVHKKTVQVPNPEYVVPDGYTQLEYIESTGTQYINTGIILKQNYIVDLKANISDANSNIWLFGSDNNNTRRFGIQADTDNGPLEGHAIFCVDSWTDGKSVNTNQLLNIRYSLESTQKFLIDDVLYGSKSNTVFDATLPLYLFADNRNGSAISLAKMKCYRFTVSLSGSTAINDFIPAKRNSDNAIGLYDLVSNTFFENAGTGTFVAVSEVPAYIEMTVDDKTLTGKWTQKPNPLLHGLPDGYTELAYIESTGTQYIDTGVQNSLELSITGDITFTDVSSGAVFGTLLNVDKRALSLDLRSSGYLVYWTADGQYGTDVDANKDVVFKTTPNSFTFDGREVSKSTDTNEISSNNICLFASYYGGNGKLIARHFEISSGTTKVRNFIPSKRNSDSKIGLYDIVNGVFYTNAGTGEFVAGPEMPQTIDGFLIKPIRDMGAWTVTAMNGEKTATQDVLVDVITDYEIEMSLTA